MRASFEEKSVWIQLISLVLALGAYFVVAAIKLSRGVSALTEFVPVLIGAVILVVVVNVAGHVVAAAAGRPEGRDERDRLIAWRAGSNSSWILGAGVIAAISGLLFSLESVWVAHLLLLSLFLSQAAAYACQLVYYRRGI